jgi:hypothetical protein
MDAAMRIVIVIALGASLAGCAHEEPAPITPVVAKPPPPKLVYNKPGATTEEFERTRAGCRVQADIGGGGLFGDTPWTALSIQRNCMRAAGWVLVPEVAPSVEK